MLEEWMKKTITLYIPKLLKKIGKSDLDSLSNAIEEYRNVLGIFPGNKSHSIPDKKLPAIDWFYIDPDKNTITIASAYIMLLLKKVEEARLDEKKKYRGTYRGNSLPPAYSFRLDPEIIGEGCDRAAAVVSVIATLIDRAGNPFKRGYRGRILRDKNGNPIIDENKVAHISFETIKNRCARFQSTYDTMLGPSSKNNLLKTVFNYAWLFIEVYTDIGDVYKDIVLPQPDLEVIEKWIKENILDVKDNKDKQKPKTKKEKNKYVPTTSRLKEVTEFPHFGKK